MFIKIDKIIIIIAPAATGKKINSNDTSDKRAIKGFAAAGGLKGASVNCEYQGSLKAEVVKPPIAEAKKVMVNIINNDKYLLFIIKI